MTVTQIVEISKTRCKVYIDEEFAFALYKGELGTFHLEEGKEVEEEDYRIIQEELLPMRVKKRCVSLLKSRDYTVWQLRRKLLQDGYSEEMAGLGIEFMLSRHYLDDFRYACHFITSKESGESKRQIEQELLQRGISREVIEKAWLQWEKDGGQRDEQKIMEKLLEQKHFDPQTADDREKERIYAFLLRKGFSQPQIFRAMHLDR